MQSDTILNYKVTTAKHVCLYFIRRTTQPGHSVLILYNTLPPPPPPKKKPYSNQTTQKFRTQKYPGIENFKPPKIDHHLKSRVHTPPPGIVRMMMYFPTCSQTIT